MAHDDRIGGSFEFHIFESVDTFLDEIKKQAPEPTDVDFIVRDAEGNGVSITTHSVQVGRVPPPNPEVRL